MKLIPALLIMMASFLSSGWANELAVGAKLPPVTATDQDGKPVDLAAETAKGWTVFFFYPRASTPGCTAQACSLRDAHADLLAKGIKVFGVSTDKPESQAKFKSEQKLPYTLLADPDQKVIQAFGVPVLLGAAKRQAYLLKDGVVVWRDTSASTKTQAADVLKAWETLQTPPAS
jgi:peroxiredoxin Q/BCP